MLTLCIDTAYKYLTCVLIKDDEILSSYSAECFKRQSEEVFGVLDDIFEAAKVDRRSIDSICISEGPGSYTGVRIAMTIAKTLSAVMPVEVYTISTLRLYAGCRENCLVVMNARAQRAYAAIYDGDQVIMEDTVIPVTQIKGDDRFVVGDGSLIGGTDDFFDITEDFLKTKHLWNRVDEVDYLAPKYLKESEEYLR